MRIAALLPLAVALSGGVAFAQQVPDLEYQPAVSRPAFAVGAGPVVCLDEARQNFHTLGGRFQAFAALLERDGYVVRANTHLFSADTLRKCRVLVIANAGMTASESASAPPTAFSRAETEAVRRWVAGGGSLLLIADHRPYGGAAAPLAAAFGVRFTDGYAVDGYLPDTSQVARPGPTLFQAEDQTLRSHAIVTGRDPSETVTSVRTFTGQAFLGPASLRPLLVFRSGYVLLPDRPAELAPGTASLDIEGWLQGGVMDVEGGRVAFFGEAATFSAQVAGPSRTPMGMNAPGAEQNFQFVLNVLHWLTRLVD